MCTLQGERTIAVERMEHRKRGIESIRDIESDAGPVFKRSRLAGAATYGTKYSIQATKLRLQLITARSFDVTKLIAMEVWE